MFYYCSRMSCNVQIPLDQFPESAQARDMVYLFDVAAKRFADATAAHSRTEEKDVRFFSVDVIDGDNYYVITLVRSYEDLLSRKLKNDELYELLIPALYVDTDAPAIEQINNNPGAYFLVRSYLGNGREEYLIARPYKFEIFTDETPEIGGADPFFGGVEDRKDCAYHLASRLNSYVMIPAGVRSMDQRKLLDVPEGTE